MMTLGKKLCAFFVQIVRQIEKLIKAKEMMEAAGKPE